MMTLRLVFSSLSSFVSSTLEEACSCNKYGSEDDFKKMDNKEQNLTFNCNGELKSLDVATNRDLHLETHQQYLPCITYPQHPVIIQMMLVQELSQDVFDHFKAKCNDENSTKKDDMDSCIICRICYDISTSDNNLMNICNCKGSVGYVHKQCMELWLQEKGTDYCDLCNHKFKIVRRPSMSKIQSFISWVTSAQNRDDQMDLIGDTLQVIFIAPCPVILTYYAHYALLNNMNLTEGGWSPTVLDIITKSFYATSLFLGITLVNSLSVSWLFYAVHKHYSRWWEWFQKSSNVNIELDD